MCRRITKPALSQDELLARGWAALPESYRIPDVAPPLSEARAWCKQLAESHYENFHVATWFLPKALRPHFHSIYAYCRISDDLGDEVGDHAVALALLDLWGQELDACYEGRARHPVFVALAETINDCFIPKGPFADLLAAFRQDQTVNRFATMDDLLAYCRYSANPVGRLVLYASGEANEDEKFRLSDATCSALQLANFWQDVRVDFAKNRVYLPQKDMEFFGVSDETIADGIATPEFRGLLRTEVEYARGSSKRLAADRHGQSRPGHRSRPLQPRRPRDSARHRTVRLRCAERAAGDLEGHQRRALMHSRRAKLLPVSWSLGLRTQEGGLSRNPVDARSGRIAGMMRLTLRAAPSPGAKPRIFITRFSPCPRRAATPSVPSTPLCARPTTWPTTRAFRAIERRRRLDAWQTHWRGVCHGGDSSDPVFIAVRDATQRFSIPLSLLDELVAGTTMDLDARQPPRRNLTPTPPSTTSIATAI